MFKKGRERRQNRRSDRKDKREERREARGGKPNKAAIGVAVGVGVLATAAGVSAYKKNKAAKDTKEGGGEETAAYYSSDDYSSDSDMEDGFEIKHPVEYTVMEVQYFLIAIGMESKCDIFEENQVNGQVMIQLTAETLEVDYGCTSIEIKKFMASIEFSFEIAEGSKKDEDKPTCTPPNKWTEVEVCLVLVAIGMGERVAKFKKAHISGAVAVSITSVELQQECGMTTVEVKKFQAIIVKTDKNGGCGIEPEADTSTMPSPPQVESSGPNKKVIGIAVGGAVLAGGLGYYAWKKNQANKDEQIQQEETVSGSGGGEEDDDDVSEPPPIKHPCDFTYVEVKYFLIAIGMESKCDQFEEKQVDGKVLVTLTKTELEAEFGCTSIEVRKFTIALEFSIEISENPPTPDSPDCGSKPTHDWSEIEVCLVLVAIGLGKKIKDFKQCHVSGAMAVSMTKVELQQECGMTTVEVKTFKAVVVKSS